MSRAPDPDAKAASHYGWTDTMPPEQIEARAHPTPSLHDQAEVNHVIYSTFGVDADTARSRLSAMGRFGISHTSQTTPPPRERGQMGVLARLAMSLAAGYAFGCALVALSNL